MDSDKIATQIEAVLKPFCPSAEVAIVSSNDLGEDQPGHYIGISAAGDIEVDKVQSIMVMTGASFVKWLNDGNGELMIYRI